MENIETIGVTFTNKINYDSKMLTRTPHYHPLQGRAYVLQHSQFAIVVTFRDINIKKEEK